MTTRVASLEEIRRRAKAGEFDQPTEIQRFSETPPIPQRQISAPLKQKKSSYSEKLKDPRWQKKRLEVLNRDYFKCIQCKDEATELHVHHKQYINNHEPWEYGIENFETLCKNCHTIIEEFKNTNYELLSIVRTKVPDYGYDYLTIFYFDPVDKRYWVEIKRKYYNSGDMISAIVMSKDAIEGLLSRLSSFSI